MLVWPQIKESDKRHTEKDPPLIKEKDLFLFLKSRIKKLDGVVISGGEPTLHPDLPEFIAKIKKLGLLVKLDTNGTNPKMLADLWKDKLIDYVAMDIKAPWEKYQLVVGVPVDYHLLKKSVKMLISKDIPHEFRTTLVPGLHTKKDVAIMAKNLVGAQRWYLQKFKSNTTLVNPKFAGKKSFTNQDMKKMANLGQKYVKDCQARGLDS